MKSPNDHVFTQNETPWMQSQSLTQCVSSRRLWHIPSCRLCESQGHSRVPITSLQSGEESRNITTCVMFNDYCRELLPFLHWYIQHMHFLYFLLYQLGVSLMRTSILCGILHEEQCSVSGFSIQEGLLEWVREPIQSCRKYNLRSVPKKKKNRKKRNALIPSFVHSSNQLQVSMFYDECESQGANAETV